MRPQKIGSPGSNGEADEAACDGETVMSVDAALEVIGFGRFQAMAMAICGMAWFVDAVEMGGMPYVYVTLDNEWGTTAADWGLLNSIKSLASTFGALAFGASADIWGRRPAFLGALTLTSIAGTACASAASFRSLLMLRCVTNVGAGGLLPVGISLLAENLPPSRRDTCMVFMQIFFVSGHVLAVLISMVLIPTGSWRLFLLALSGPPMLLLLAIVKLLPESPVFLQQSGQLAEAQLALNTICRYNGRPEWGARVPQDTAATKTEDAALSHQPKRGFYRISSRWGLATRAVAFGLLWAFCMTASDWKSWVTEIGNNHGSSEHSVATFMLLIEIEGIAGFLSAAWLARGGRGPAVLRGALAAATISALIAALLVGDPISAAFLCSVLGLDFAYDMVWGLLYATTATAFDPLCRASALSIASCFSKAAASAVPLVSSSLLLRAGESMALFFWASAWAAATCLALAINFAESTSGIGIWRRRPDANIDSGAPGPEPL